MVVTFMEYAFYFTLCVLLLGFIFYIRRKLIKRANNNRVINSVVTIPTVEALDDDFICFIKSDGSTLVSSNGVVVVGKKIESDS
jgi:hypothetical protein